MPGRTKPLPPGLDGAARALKALVGQSGFVRRDKRRRALFISDFPRHMGQAEQDALTARLAAQGWQHQAEDGLMLLDWPHAGYAAFFEHLAAACAPDAHGLARILRRHPAAFTPQMLPQARQALLLWDAGQLPELATAAGAALAVSLRTHAAIPGFYAPLLDSLAARQARQSPE